MTSVLRQRLKRWTSGCMLLLLSLSVLASPEYQRWLAQQRQPLALPDQALDWSQPPSAEYPVRMGQFRPLIQNHSNVHERIDTPVHGRAPAPYRPPVMAFQYRQALVVLYGVTVAVHIPQGFDTYWSSPSAGEQALSGRQRALIGLVARQLDTIRQHYQWSHWDLMQLAGKLALDLQPEDNPAKLQWALLSSLGLDVALGRYQGTWFLLYHPKQRLLGPPSISTERGYYYIDQGEALQQDASLEVWFAQHPITSRLNLAPHPDAYYGSDWRAVSLGQTEKQRLSIPVEYARVQAVSAVPLFDIQDYLALQWPRYLDAILYAASGKAVKNEPNVATHVQLIRFIDQLYPDNPTDEVALMAVSTSLPVPANMSALRAFVLKRLLILNKYEQLVAIESGDSLTLAIRASGDNDHTTPLFGAPYELLNMGPRSKVVPVRKDTLGLTKDRVFSLY